MKNTLENKIIKLKQTANKEDILNIPGCIPFVEDNCEDKLLFEESNENFVVTVEQFGSSPSDSAEIVKKIGFIGDGAYFGIKEITSDFSLKYSKNLKAATYNSWKLKGNHNILSEAEIFAFILSMQRWGVMREQIKHPIDYLMTSNNAWDALPLKLKNELESIAFNKDNNLFKDFLWKLLNRELSSTLLSIEDLIKFDIFKGDRVRVFNDQSIKSYQNRVFSCDERKIEVDVLATTYSLLNDKKGCISSMMLSLNKCFNVHVVASRETGTIKSIEMTANSIKFNNEAPSLMPQKKINNKISTCEVVAEWDKTGLNPFCRAVKFPHFIKWFGLPKGVIFSKNKNKYDFFYGKLENLELEDKKVLENIYPILSKENRELIHYIIASRKPDGKKESGKSFLSDGFTSDFNFSFIYNELNKTLNELNIEWEEITDDIMDLLLLNMPLLSKLKDMRKECILFLSKIEDCLNNFEGDFKTIEFIRKLNKICSEFEWS